MRGFARLTLAALVIAMGQDLYKAFPSDYSKNPTRGLPVLEGRASVDGFALVDLNPPSTSDTSASVSVGAQFQMAL